MMNALVKYTIGISFNGTALAANIGIYWQILDLLPPVAPKPFSLKTQVEKGKEKKIVKEYSS